VFLSPFGHAIVAEPLLYHEPSVLGRDLNYWVLGDGPTTIFMLGGMHGDEVSSSEVVYDFLAHVLRYPDALASLRVVVVPEVNPDGLAALTRCNERGVDINRNFPASNWDAKSRLVINAPGEYPESEPETRFVLDLLERYPPDCVVVTHAAAACVNWDGPAKPLARALSLESRLPMRSSLGYATPGSLGNYLGADRAVPTITLELAHKEPNEKTRERRTLLKVLELAPPPRASLVE
jgi:predicted deacylase